MEKILKQFTLDFFGNGKHKISPEKFFESENGLLLDVRSREEAASVSIQMSYHPNIESLNIPINEIPDRVDEIPRGKVVGIFCPANVRSAMVYAYLLSQGFSEIRLLEDGYSGLTAALKPGHVLRVVKGNQK